MDITMKKTLVSTLALIALAGCASRPATAPLPVMGYVDLSRFMGDWYVIASIPTFIEKDAYDAVESYQLDADGSIATTFTFRKGAFDGPRKTYRPRGFVFDRKSNAVWGMRFVWPIKADYRIAHVDENYQETIIGREARDYVWIMARRPQLNPTDYCRLQALVARAGYDVKQLRQVPQGVDKPAIVCAQ